LCEGKQVSSADRQLEANPALRLCGLALLDCHRTWEALCLGAIPIVKAPHFSAMFSGLPVLVVNRWSDVTENLLRQTIHSFRNKPFDGYNKLNLDYWKQEIRKYKN
jgi:hypothetical protein